MSALESGGNVQHGPKPRRSNAEACCECSSRSRRITISVSVLLRKLCGFADILNTNCVRADRWRQSVRLRNIHGGQGRQNNVCTNICYVCMCVACYIIGWLAICVGRRAVEVVVNKRTHVREMCSLGRNSFRVCVCGVHMSGFVSE